MDQLTVSRSSPKLDDEVRVWLKGGIQNIEKSIQHPLKILWIVAFEDNICCTHDVTDFSAIFDFGSMFSSKKNGKTLGQ